MLLTIMNLTRVGPLNQWGFGEPSPCPSDSDGPNLTLTCSNVIDKAKQ